MNDHPLALTSLLSIDTLKVNTTVKDWEEAVDVAGGLLVRAGKTKVEYTSAMKRVLKEMGPYAVIAPGIVLLHARPEDGVLSACLAVVTLSTPVAFGHSENDPVDLVLALGATDKNSHIAALQQMALILSDKEKLQIIRTAENEAGLMEILSLPSASKPE